MHREPRRQLSNAAFASHSPHIKLASPKEAASTTRRDTWSLTGRPGTAGLLATSPRSRMAACGGPRDAGDASARLSVEKLTKLLQASPALPTEGRPGKGKGKSAPRRTRAARAAALGKGGGGGGAVAAVPLEESLARQASAAAGEAGSSAVLEGALAAGEVGWLAGEDGYEWRSLAFRDGGMTVYACAWARTWCPSARPFATLPLLPCPRPLAIRPAHLASLMHHRESAIAVVATAYSYAPARVPSPPPQPPRSRPDGHGARYKTETGDSYAGAVGAQTYTGGRHTFAFRVHQPVDDAFWVGVAYPDVDPTLPPKRNTRCIAWSGGSPGSTGRPGTLRVHGEKLRNQPTYGDGAVIGVEVDMDTRSISFFRDNEMVIRWNSVLRGPVAPFASIRHGDGPAVTLLQDWRPAAGQTSDRYSVEPSFPPRDVIGEADVAPLPTVDGAVLEGGGQVLRVALACGALFGRPLRVRQIRGLRPKPGLGHQHSTGAKLVTDVSPRVTTRRKRRRLVGLRVGASPGRGDGWVEGVGAACLSSLTLTLVLLAAPDGRRT